MNSDIDPIKGPRPLRRDEYEVCAYGERTIVRSVRRAREVALRASRWCYDVRVFDADGEIVSIALEVAL